MQEDQNEAQTESIPGTEELLRQAELLVEEHKDAWIRAKAETENVRKRAQLDIANAHKYAVENFSTELLAVKDSLEKAISVENATMEAMKDGIELTLKQLNAVFTKFNLEEIDPAGQKFDPHQHQAISAIDSKEAPNTVVQVLQKGYKLNDRIIRPALVIVSKSA
jgi:molecular chaperone GrpE